MSEDEQTRQTLRRGASWRQPDSWLDMSFGWVGVVALALTAAFALSLLAATFWPASERWMRGLLGTPGKTETLHFLSLALSGAAAMLGLVVLSRRAEVQAEAAVARAAGGRDKRAREGKSWRQPTSWLDFSFGWMGVVALALTVAFSLALVAATFWPASEQWMRGLLGTPGKTETLHFLSLALSGAGAMLGLIVLNRRVEAQVEANLLMGRGHVQERFKQAAEHLGSDHAALRIAAFSEFERLAGDHPDYRQSAADIMCAHLRAGASFLSVATSADGAQGQGQAGALGEEQQSALDALLKLCAGTGARELPIDLSRARLRGANLQGAQLQGAKLHGTDLRDAQLQGADLRDAQLQGVGLRNAQLQGVGLRNAQLQGVGLQDANLQGAKLQSADLRDAQLQEADLQEANLQETKLQSADLRGAQLQGADLQEANLQGAQLQSADLRGAQLQSVNLRQAQLGGAQYDKNTRFPDGFAGPEAPPADGSPAQFPQGFSVA